MLLCSSIRLHQERFLDDLLDVSLLSSGAPISVALSDAEPFGSPIPLKSSQEVLLYNPQLRLAINLIAVMLGRKQYAAARVVTKLEKPVIFIGDAPFACGITKMLSAGSCVPIIGSFDLGCSLTAPANSLSLTQCPSTNSYWFSIFELMK